MLKKIWARLRALLGRPSTGCPECEPSRKDGETYCRSCGTVVGLEAQIKSLGLKFRPLEDGAAVYNHVPQGHLILATVYTDGGAGDLFDGTGSEYLVLSLDGDGRIHGQLVEEGQEDSAVFYYHRGVVENPDVLERLRKQLLESGDSELREQIRVEKARHRKQMAEYQGHLKRIASAYK